MARRYRTVTEQLGSILIAFEVISVALVALALFGLRALPAGTALGGGAVFVLAFVAGVYFLRFNWGRWYVLGLQVLLTLGGFLDSIVFIVGGLFLAVWLFCMFRGGKIDAERAPIIAEFERALAAGEIDETGAPLDDTGAPRAATTTD
ncbi:MULTISPECIES: DUF4233 domain-containing protein [Gulosibacter]|uniref:DUF4233 domain-containing protein n=1 Tax=Gulosibacter TaxID=256818 RepID=UPI0013DE3B14|nr:MULTISPECIES: DUF4233 domain-containing protein [Gulosibacter]